MEKSNKVEWTKVIACQKAHTIVDKKPKNVELMFKIVNKFSKININGQNTSREQTKYMRKYLHGCHLLCPLLFPFL